MIAMQSKNLFLLPYLNFAQRSVSPGHELSVSSPFTLGLWVFHMDIHCLQKKQVDCSDLTKSGFFKLLVHLTVIKYRILCIWQILCFKKLRSIDIDPFCPLISLFAYLIR